MSSSTYSVVGMTCSSCATSVTEEIKLLPGVEDVAVDLASGQVTVSSTTPLAESLVRDAVEEAGYQLGSQ